MDTGESWTEEFCDPYLYNVNGQCWQWNGSRWGIGVSYGGVPIIDRLPRAFPKHPEDPPRDRK